MLSKPHRSVDELIARTENDDTAPRAPYPPFRIGPEGQQPKLT